MYVIIAYDVNTETPAGKKRLRQISKSCLNYGKRVQNSLFECLIDYGTFLTLKKRIEDIMDKEKDSLRYYYLGNKWKGKIEHIGNKETVDLDGPLIL
ncbi:MAG: CRISPR-associated endonuclease Cas2 [Christensenellaceae bacterium]